MNETELRKHIGDARVNEIKELIRKARDEGKSPDEIEAALRKYIKEFTDVIWNVIGNLVAFLPPGPPPKKA